MWGRLRGQVLRSEEKDNGEDDTIISRALLRYYAPEVPPWLAPPPTVAGVPPQHIEQLNYQTQYQQQYLRREFNNTDRSHIFDRKNSAASIRETPSPTPSHGASSGGKSSSLANRLKNSKW